MQDETFVPLRGTLTMYVGEPPERYEVPVGGLVHVEAGTVLQIVNETDEALVVFVCGASVLVRTSSRAPSSPAPMSGRSVAGPPAAFCSCPMF